MFIYAIKASTLKFALLTVLTVALVGVLIWFMPKSENVNAVETVSSEDAIKSGKIKNASELAAFISSLGWEVNENPTEIVDVTIPQSFNETYLKYNEIQKKQGLNLEKLKGKNAKRYTFEVNNYPSTSEKVYLNLIIYKNKVIAGDVCSAEVNGFMHGIKLDKVGENS